MWRGWFCDKGSDRFSFGKAVGWLLLLAALYVWLWRGVDVQDGHLWALFSALGYTTATKFVKGTAEPAAKALVLPRAERDV